MSVSLSASVEKDRPFASRWLNKKASIGLRTQSACFTTGGATGFGGWNDQKFRSLSETRGSASVPASSDGSATTGAPNSIHRATLAVSASVAGLTPTTINRFFGGISPDRIIFTIRLS